MKMRIKKSNLLFLGIVIFSICFFALLILHQSPKLPKYLEPISERTAICYNRWICVLLNDSWHRPAYDTGIDLDIAKHFPSRNESEIRELIFESNQIVFLFEENGSAVEVARAAPASYYIAYLSKRLYNKDINITGKVFLDPNFNGTVIKIFHPSPSFKEGIFLEGNTIEVKSRDYEGLRKAIGKLILIVAGYNDK